MTLAPVSVSARPTIPRPSSITTALVWVDPTSTPAAYDMRPPLRRRRVRLVAPRREPFEEGVDPVLHLRLRHHALVHHVGLDEETRDVPDRHQRPPRVGEAGRYRPAALDRVKYDAVHRVVVDHLDERLGLEEHAVHRVAHAE